MSMTRQITQDAISELQHATAAIRRLNMLARMGALPDPDDYRILHRTATSFNAAFRDLIRAIQAQQEEPETTQ